MNSRTPPRALTWGLIGIMLFAFALRLFRLDAQSIWWDEGISLHLATSPLPVLLTDRLNNIHPPLYFILLKGWTTLVGVSPFAARYLSVLAGWLQVALVFALLRRWFGLRTALVGAGLAAVTAVSVIYAQEIRVYAMLPLIYLALLGLTQALVARGPARPSRPAHWVVLGLVAWIGLHLHYIVGFVVAYVALWAGLAFVRQRRWGDLRRGLLTLAVVGAASLPWFVAVVANWQVVQAEANAGTFAAEPVPLRFLLEQVWVFHLTGLPGALARSAVRWLAGGTAVALAAASILNLIPRPARWPTASLLSHWLLPLASALVVWSVRSFSHPRYVAIFVSGLTLLVASLLLPGARRQLPGRGWRLAGSLAAGALGVGVVTASLVGLWLYFFDAGAAKDDVRGVASYLEARTAPGDLILVPETDWSLPFEYAGEATVAMPGVEGSAGWARLGALTAAGQRVFEVDYVRGTRDWQDVVPFALERAGALEAEEPIDALLVRRYELEKAVSSPEFTPASVRIGPLRLTGVSLEQDAAAGTAVTVALRWQLLEPVDERLHAALQLQDTDGWLLAAADRRLVDENGRPTDQWQPDQSVTTYHVLPVAPGTPPLRYPLALGLYAPQSDGGVRNLDVLDADGAPQGQQAALGEVQLSRGRSDVESAYGVTAVPVLPQPIELAPGLQLAGMGVLPDRVAPGQVVDVELLWQATAPDLPDLRPRLALLQDGRLLVESAGAPALGRYPTARWADGELVGEHRRLVVPAQAEGGPLQLALSVDGPPVVLGEVTLDAAARGFTRPEVAYALDVEFVGVGRLVGFDLPQQSVTTGDTVPLTLVWESLTTGTPVGYTVFAHILDGNGRLIGQHDAPPANGQRPTTGWVAGEFIVDPHEMTFRERGYSGTAVIEVGFYVPATGVRVPTAAGADYFVLPVTLQVAE